MIGFKHFPQINKYSISTLPFSPAETSLLLKIIRKGLVESKLDLEIQRQDPTSPLYSVKTFEKLHLYVGMNYSFLNYITTNKCFQKT